MDFGCRIGLLPSAAGRATPPEATGIEPGTRDGLRLDVEGNVWTSDGGGVHCYSPAGERLGSIEFPEPFANPTFGGRRRNRLFITASSSLYAVFHDTRGVQAPHTGRTRSMLLGCVADDLTGATDLALMLTREGLRTVQVNEVPPEDLDLSGIDAVVVALKSRMLPAAEAVALSLRTAEKLRTLGARRLMFKYCSTFDSTDAGNIGPVGEALLAFAGGGLTIFCPAFPRAGRSVYCGTLFVNGVPLNESPMKDHPLTPMHDANLCRVLQRQTKLPVGLVGFADVEAGTEAIGAAITREAAAGRRALVVDAVTDDHLRLVGRAIADLPLITGGSGIVMGLPAAYLERGLLGRLTPPPQTIAAPPGRSIVLAGSCSAATRGQVARAVAAGMPAFRVDPMALADGRLDAAAVLGWLDTVPPDGPVIVYSSADPDAVRAVQDRLGSGAAGHMVEDLLAAVAAALPARGFTRLVVAGGETSGAVVGALGIRALKIGPEIDPGVPWTLSLAAPRVALALKSGNFGSQDFFLKAWDKLT